MSTVRSIRLVVIVAFALGKSVAIAGSPPLTLDDLATTFETVESDLCEDRASAACLAYQAFASGAPPSIPARPTFTIGRLYVGAEASSEQFVVVAVKRVGSATQVASFDLRPDNDPHNVQERRDLLALLERLKKPGAVRTTGRTAAYVEKALGERRYGPTRVLGKTLLVELAKNGPTLFRTAFVRQSGGSLYVLRIAFGEAPRPMLVVAPAW